MKTPIEQVLPISVSVNEKFDGPILLLKDIVLPSLPVSVKLSEGHATSIPGRQYPLFQSAPGIDSGT